jgi:hypothetical protein
VVFAVEAAFGSGGSQIGRCPVLFPFRFFDTPTSLERFALCAGLIYHSLWS